MYAFAFLFFLSTSLRFLQYLSMFKLFHEGLRPALEDLYGLDIDTVLTLKTEFLLVFIVLLNQERREGND